MFRAASYMVGNIDNAINLIPPVGKLLEIYKNETKLMRTHRMSMLFVLLAYFIDFIYFLTLNWREFV